MFGAPVPECGEANCGAYSVSFEGMPVSKAGGSSPVLQVRASTTYPRAGRYIIRLEASDARGGWLSTDFPIVVRKDNDTARLAPCCRCGIPCMEVWGQSSLQLLRVIRRLCKSIVVFNIMSHTVYVPHLCD